MNDAQKEQVLVTNKHPFFREKGQRCRVCGSYEEVLWVYNGIIFLECPKCGCQKGGDVFRESNLKVKGDHYPYYDHCPYCGHRNKTEMIYEEGENGETGTYCEKCGKPDPEDLPCPKCGSQRGTFSKEGETLKIICFDCGAIKLIIPNAK